MNIIIPMAGMGKRLRPHTLTVPKPLVRIAGKPIVQHLVEDIARMVEEPLEKMVFVTGRFGEEIEKHLLETAKRLGAEGEIVYQDEALGTAHAIWCARQALEGKVIVAFADTLFTADFSLDSEADGVLWVKQIDNPSAFGVVKLNDEGHIVDFVEKPKNFVSDLAMIGVYYFKDGAALREEIQYLIDHRQMKNGEYQLPDALRRLTERGMRFSAGKVDEWMDCGNPKVTIETSQRVLQLKYPDSKIDPTARIEQSIVIDPCYIGPGAHISHSIIGPGVSVGESSEITNCRISKSLIQDHTILMGTFIDESMIGSHARYEMAAKKLSLGDYNCVS